MSKLTSMCNIVKALIQNYHSFYFNMNEEYECKDMVFHGLTIGGDYTLKYSARISDQLTKGYYFIILIGTLTNTWQSNEK